MSLICEELEAPDPVGVQANPNHAYTEHAYCVARYLMDYAINEGRLGPSAWFKHGFTTEEMHVGTPDVEFVIEFTFLNGGCFPTFVTFDAHGLPTGIKKDAPPGCFYFAPIPTTLDDVRSEEHVQQQEGGASTAQQEGGASTAQQEGGASTAQQEGGARAAQEQEGGARAAQEQEGDLDPASAARHNKNKKMNKKKKNKNTKKGGRKNTHVNKANNANNGATKNDKGDKDKQPSVDPSVDVRRAPTMADMQGAVFAMFPSAVKKAGYTLAVIETPKEGLSEFECSQFRLVYGKLDRSATSS